MHAHKLQALLLAAAGAVTAAPTATADAVEVPSTVPEKAGAPILQPFLGYSIEFFFWPDFAGNLSHPNKFSSNLLDNLGELQGVKPYIRVGGNTQDLSLYDPNLKSAVAGTIDYSTRFHDYPLNIKIGPSFYESFQVFKDVKHSYGFNLAVNGTLGEKNTNETVDLACKALENGRLAYWEVGNEPDHYPTVGTTTTVMLRSKEWKEAGYVSDWLARSRLIKERIKETCPGITEKENQFMAPSFAEIYSLNTVKVWSQEKLGQDKDIVVNSMHYYVGGAKQAGVTLAHTLMNHTKLVQTVSPYLQLRSQLQAGTTAKDIPFILGEANSLFQQGAKSLSESFGAALWNVDFSLYIASKGIGRVHMHQGTDYRYSSWQPVQTEKTVIGTRAPYYGNIMTAAMMKGDGHSDVRIAELPLGENKDKETEVAYAAYDGDKLKRVAIINMKQYNSTHTATGATKPPSDQGKRPKESYTFKLPATAKSATIQRLVAPGSDTITGITFDGWSYNYELAQGKPMRMDNVVYGEVLHPDSNGYVTITLPHSSAAILSLAE